MLNWQNYISWIFINTVVIAIENEIASTTSIINNMRHFIIIGWISSITVLLFISSSFFSQKNNISPVHSFQKDTILIVSMRFADNDLLLPVGNKITEFYHIPVKYIQGQLPQEAYLKVRNRYDASTIIRSLHAINKAGYRFVVGLTSEDISMPKNGTPDYGIFGLGSLDGSGCISSVKRLKKNVSRRQLQERLFKVVLHEIGHNYGIPHCTNTDPCFMKSADGKVATVDHEPMYMCVSCKKKMRNG